MTLRIQNLLTINMALLITIWFEIQNKRMKLSLDEGLENGLFEINSHREIDPPNYDQHIFIVLLKSIKSMTYLNALL